MAVVTVDFDGTLFQGNSFKVMFRVAKKDFTWREWGVVFAGMVKALFAGLFKGKNALRHAFFKAFAKAFKGKTKTELDTFFHKLVSVGRKEVHQKLVETIHEHQRDGAAVIVLSGALFPFLQAFTKELELDVHIIGTELQFDKQGICTGKIGPIINGEEKVKKVQAWLEQDGQDQKVPDHHPREIWTYADSESDIPLFQFVQHPVVVNPDEQMKRIAKQNEWPIFV